MDKSTFEIEKEVRDKLDHVFRDGEEWEYESLPEICDQSKNLIEDILREYVIEFLAIEITKQGSACFEVNSSYLVVGNRAFSISLGENVLVLGVIVLSITAAKKKDSNSDKENRSIELGLSTPYSNLELDIDTELGGFSEQLLDLCKTVIESGYSWLEELIKYKLQEEDTDLIGELYKIARRALPEGVSNEIYFYALHKEKGVFVFDQLARENVLKKCKSRAIEIPHSPLLALSQLSCFTIPSKDAVAQELVPKDETRSFDPLVIKSARTELGFPQFILFGDSHLTAQPLVGREGGLVKGEKWLMVAYPTDLRSEIEPRISLIREEFLIIQDIKKKNLTSGSESKMKRAWDATELKPGAFGVRFDLKKYLRKR